MGHRAPSPSRTSRSLGARALKVSFCGDIDRSGDFPETALFPDQENKQFQEIVPYTDTFLFKKTTHSGNIATVIAKDTAKTPVAR
jgi:hypothetical protein